MILALTLPGTWEWIVLCIIVVLIFGRRIPEIARAAGQGVLELRRLWLSRDKPDQAGAIEAKHKAVRRLERDL